MTDWALTIKYIYISIYLIQCEWAFKLMITTLRIPVRHFTAHAISRKKINTLSVTPYHLHYLICSLIDYTDSISLDQSLIFICWFLNLIFLPFYIFGGKGGLLNDAYPFRETLTLVDDRPPYPATTIHFLILLGGLAVGASHCYGTWSTTLFKTSSAWGRRHNCNV